MTRRPTAAERDNAAAWLEYNARVQERGAAILRTLLAVVLGVLGAVAMIHWATPCAEGALCTVLAVRWPPAGCRACWPCGPRSLWAAGLVATLAAITLWWLP